MMITKKFGELYYFSQKSKIQAGAGLDEGEFPFYTSSSTLKKWIDKSEFNTNALVFGTGGIASIHFANGRFAVSTDCLVACSQQEEVNIKYTFYYLHSNLHILERGFKGAGLKHISKSYIQNIEISYPNLDTQNKIVAILDKATDIIQKREKSIKQLDELIRATFLDMFGDPVKNPYTFPLRNLTDFYINPKIGTKCGPFGSALKIEDYSESGIPVWNMDNISKSMEFNPVPNLFIPEKKYDDLKKYNTINGDIIISRAGTVGKMCIVNTDFVDSIISTNLIRLRLDSESLLPIYFIFLIRYSKEGIIRLRKGSEDAFSHMNTGILDSITFPYPQIELQKKFANTLTHIEAIKQKHKTSLQQIQNLSKALLQQAFRGELEFNTAVDLEILLENDYNFFKENSNKKTIELLLQRLDKSELNEQKFYNQDEYGKAKELVFNLLKDGKIKQVFDTKTNQVKLTV